MRTKSSVPRVQLQEKKKTRLENDLPYSAFIATKTNNHLKSI